MWTLSCQSCVKTLFDVQKTKNDTIICPKCRHSLQISDFIAVFPVFKHEFLESIIYLTLTKFKHKKNRKVKKKQ